MKYTSIILFIFFSLNADCQKLYPIKLVRDSFKFKIGFVDGKMLMVKSDPNLTLSAPKGFPNILKIELEESDIVLTYRRALGEQEQSYRLNMRLKRQDGVQIIPSAYALSNEQPISGTPNEFHLSWMNVVEDNLEFDTEYTLFIERSLMGAVNCETPRPEFNLRQKIPYYTIVSAGLVLCGLGQIYFSQSSNQYDQYTSFWKQGKPLSESQTFYNQAKIADRNAKICTYTGLGIATISTVLYYLKWKKIHKKQRVYDQFCANQGLTSLQNALSTSLFTPTFKDQTANLTLVFTF